MEIQGPPLPFERYWAALTQGRVAFVICEEERDIHLISPRTAFQLLRPQGATEERFTELLVEECNADNFYVEKCALFDSTF